MLSAEQEFYDKGVLVAMVKAFELAFEAMVNAGIIVESAYYESFLRLCR